MREHQCFAVGAPISYPANVFLKRHVGYIKERDYNGGFPLLHVQWVENNSTNWVNQSECTPEFKLHVVGQVVRNAA